MQAALTTRPRDARSLVDYASRHDSHRGILVNLDTPGTLTTSTGLEVIHVPAYMVGLLPRFVH